MSLQICGLNLAEDQKELQPHGSVEFPCAGYESIHGTAPGEVVPWHWHTEFELVYVAEGSAILKIPSETCLLHRGELALINSGVLHYAEGAPTCCLQSLVFSPLLLTGNVGSIYAKIYVSPIMNCRTLRLMGPEPEPEVRRRFRRAFEALRGNTCGNEFIVRGELSEIFLRFFEQYQSCLHDPEKEKDTDSLRMEKMLDFIHGNYRQPLSLAQISRAAAISERECLRCFKRTISESPIKYLTKYRLMQSAVMLRTMKNRSVSEVAAASGFDSPGYYAKQFKLYYKETPLHYRKRHEIEGD